MLYNFLTFPDIPKMACESPLRFALVIITVVITCVVFVFNGLAAAGGEGNSKELSFFPFFFFFFFLFSCIAEYECGTCFRASYSKLG